MEGIHPGGRHSSLPRGISFKFLSPCANGTAGICIFGRIDISYIFVFPMFFFYSIAMSDTGRRTELNLKQSLQLIKSAQWRTERNRTSFLAFQVPRKHTVDVFRKPPTPSGHINACVDGVIHYPKPSTLNQHQQGSPISFIDWTILHPHPPRSRKAAAADSSPAAGVATDALSVSLRRHALRVSWLREESSGFLERRRCPTLPPNGNFPEHHRLKSALGKGYVRFQEA